MLLYVLLCRLGSAAVQCSATTTLQSTCTDTLLLSTQSMPGCWQPAFVRIIADKADSRHGCKNAQTVFTLLHAFRSSHSTGATQRAVPICTNHVERQPLGVLMRLVPKVSWRTQRITAPNGSREVLFRSAGSRRATRLFALATHTCRAV
jgi:hypothetical protein